MSDSRKGEAIHAFFDNAPFGLATLQEVRNPKGEIIDFRFIDVNPHARRLYHDQQEIIGKLLSTLYDKAEFAKKLKFFSSVVTDNKTIRFEEPFTTQGRERWYEISAWPASCGFVISLREMSRLKRTRKELDQKRVEYDKLFHESVDPVFVSNNEHQIIDVNPEMKALFGYHEEDHLTLKDLFYHEEDFQHVNLQLYKEDVIKDYEADLVRKDGTPLICSLSLKKFNDSQGLETYLGFLQNITERKRTEQNLIMAEKLSLTGKIARTIAHEVRNPLTNLNLALEQLKEEISEESDGDFYIDIIKRNMVRIQQLIDDLLSSSKPKEYKFKDTDLREVVQNSVALIEDRFLLKDMHIEQVYPGEPVMAAVDQEQIQVAFLNLFVNAAEAMQPGQGRLKITIESSKDYHKLSFVDNGKGISKEKIKNLFEPFFTHSKESGTGLGLTAVQNIIHGHKGIIEVDSVLGEGTHFTITLPRAVN